MEFNFERDVYMYGEVNTGSVFKVIERLNALNRYDEEMLTNGPRNYKPQPIALYINSGGGSIYDGLALYSAIKNSSTPVVTIGNGMVGSAALLIFLGGKYRISYPYATFLFHSPKWGILNSTPSQVRDFNDYYGRMSKQLTEITQKECKLSDAMIDKVYKEDYQLYMTPEQALAVGICDMIYDLEAISEKKKKGSEATQEIIDMIKKISEEAEQAEADGVEKQEPKEEGDLVKIEEGKTGVKEKVIDLDELEKELKDDACTCDECTRVREALKVKKVCDCDACKEQRREHK